MEFCIPFDAPKYSVSQVLDAWEEYQFAKEAAAAIGIETDEKVEEAAKKYRRIWAKYVEEENDW